MNSKTKKHMQQILFVYDAVWIFYFKHCTHYSSVILPFSAYYLFNLRNFTIKYKVIVLKKILIFLNLNDLHGSRFGRPV